MKTRITMKRIFMAITLMAIPVAMLLLAGCPAPGPGGGQTTGGGSREPQFSWDTSRPEPRWRSDSPIEWMRTSEKAEAIADARSTGKTILCYVSRYDSDITPTIEENLFTEDTWGQKIADNFVTWELNWWEDPELAQTFLGDSSAPAIFVLIPSPDERSDELKIIDGWMDAQILSFPLHGFTDPMDDPASDERIAEFATIPWDSAMLPGIPYEDVNSEEFMDEQLDSLASWLVEGHGLFPSEILFEEYKTQEELGRAMLNARVAAWGDYADTEEIVWLPDDDFDPGAGWGIDPVDTIKAAICADAVDASWPVSREALAESIRSLLFTQEEGLGGGFPAYFDIRGTFDTVNMYVTDEERLSPDITARLEDPAMGPRDIVWINARALAWLYRLVAVDSEFADIEVAAGVTMSDFVNAASNVMIPSLLEKAGDTSSMKFQDRVYLLDLLNQAYQHTAEISWLDKAGEIARYFNPEETDSWFEPKMYIMLPDLAIALHQYGWLAEDEDPREAADYVTEEGPKYTAGFPALYDTMLAYAYDVVHSKCIHVGIVAPLDDELGKELLAFSLERWEPRLVAQILDPERDAELIERKGYASTGETSAFVCIDDVCFMPSHDVDDLGENIAMAKEEIAQEEDKGD